MKTPFFLLAIITSILSVGQTSETKTFGSTTYEVMSSKSTDKKHTFQTIELREGVALYSQIVKAISAGKIKTYSNDAGFPKITEVVKIELGFVTYEGYNACGNVTREYVDVQVTGNSSAGAMIHYEQFSKVMASYKEGKHLSMVKEFLYNTTFSIIPSVVFLPE